MLSDAAFADTPAERQALPFAQAAQTLVSFWNPLNICSFNIHQFATDLIVCWCFSLFPEQMSDSDLISALNSFPRKKKSSKKLITNEHQNLSWILMCTVALWWCGFCLSFHTDYNFASICTYSLQYMHLCISTVYKLE